jgi:hypothetical protein
VLIGILVSHDGTANRDAPARRMLARTGASRSLRCIRRSGEHVRSDLRSFVQVDARAGSRRASGFHETSKSVHGFVR